MKHRQRVTTCSNYAELEEKLNERRKQFVPDGWTDLQDRLPSIRGYFAYNNGLQAHLITHNSDPGRMKRIELETPTGNIVTAWTDS
jgi:hypothetical protein